MTNISDLKALGAFFSEAPVQKEIKFILDGQEYDAKIWVKKVSAGDRDRLAKLSAGDDRSVTAVVISEIISLGEDGSEKLLLEDAFRLAPSLADAMMVAAKEVNGGQERKN